MVMPVDPKKLRLLDNFIANSRNRLGPRPKTLAESKWIKGMDPEYNFKIPSSDPANMAAFRRDGMSYKMIPSDRIYANQWYANPENQARAGYQHPVDPQVFKQEFAHRRGNLTEAENEIAQRDYDREVGREVARQVAANRMVQRRFSPENEVEVTVPTWAMNYIANGDPTGLSPDEIASVDNFLMQYGNQYRLLDEEPGFYRRNDMPGEPGRLGADAYRANFYPPVDRFGRPLK